ncbi:MAG: hypothetical protein J5835_05990, partial [Bacteroidales bacterium]|nr:hypothetical protein [Bacteroidales bacterium]
ATGQIQFYPWINAQWEYFKNPDGSVANVTFTSDCFGTTVTGKVKYYEVNGVRTCKTETGGQGMFGNGNDREWYFVWYTDSDRIKLPIQLCGFTYQGYGEATVISPYYYFGVLNADNNPDIGTYWDFIQNYPSQPECYYDGNGGFYFGVQWYLFMDYGQGFSPQAIDVVGEADGFDRKDYSGSIYVGSAIEGTREIWFNVGRDISAVRYVFIDEKIDDEEKAGAIAAQLAEGSIDFETLTIDMFETDNGRSYYTYINYTAEVPGYHTVIAVGLDAQGEWRFWYYYWFNLDPVEDTSGYTWTSIGTGSYTDDIIASVYDGAENLTWDVEIEQCNEDPSRIRMVYPYDGKFKYNAEGEWATDMSYDIEIMIPDEKHVYILPQKTGMDWGDGMISMASFAGYYISNGWAIEEIEQSKGVEFFGTLVDGVITFPVKGCVVYEGENLYYANNNGAFKLVLPGYAAGGSDGEGTVGATGVARRSAKKTGKTVETMTSGNGGGGRAIKPRPVLEIVR